MRPRLDVESREKLIQNMNEIKFTRLQVNVVGEQCEDSKLNFNIIIIRNDMHHTNNLINYSLSITF